MPAASRVRVSVRLVPLLLLLTLVGCARTPSVSLPVNVPDTFAASGTADPSSRWWTAFEDSTLNRLVEDALDSSLTLRATWARLQSARAVAQREGAPRYPALEATADADKTLSSDEAGESEQVVLGLGATYELDLWGRIRARANAEGYRAGAALEDYRTAALSLAAEISTVWYRLAEAQSQVDLLTDQLRTNQSVLELLENRFTAGLIRGVDVLRQRQLVAFAREQRFLAAARRDVLAHSLAVLSGRPPKEAPSPPAHRLPALPPVPDSGIPVDLVRRRPDIRAAYQRLLAADRDMASALSARYPRLSFSTSATTAAGGADKLFENWVVSFAGNLLAPLFLGGELSAEVERTRGEREQRAYEYGQTVLTAFQEVEDALALERGRTRALNSLEEQLDLATRAYEQLRVEYLNGAGSYIDVLLALDGVQELQRDVLAARLGLIEIRIALYRALAGPFDTGRELS